MTIAHKRSESRSRSGGMQSGEEEWRFGASEYANTVPLLYCLREVLPGALLIKRVPSAMPGLLRGGNVDVALVPIGALLTDDTMEMIPGVGVCARGAVQSVLVKLHKPIGEVIRLRLDAASRTSNVLANIILTRRYGRSVEMVGAEDAGDVDAEVMIGDRALCSEPARCGDLDLGGEWRAMTALPFVFAVWACRRGDPRRDEYIDVVQRARDTGMKAMPQIVSEESVRLGLSRARCEAYLTGCIHYTVGCREVESIELFRTMLLGEGLSSPAGVIGWGTDRE